jgi:type III restriction enzyme
MLVGSFVPDFFIKIKHKNQPHFIVVEIKADNDGSDENKAKNKYAKLHFENLNAELKAKKIKETYHFHFLSPSSYVVFLII